MKTTAEPFAGSVSPPASQATPWEIYANAAWNIVVAIACVALSIFVFGLQDFGRLGKPVQFFVAVLILVPAVTAIYSSLALLIAKPTNGAESPSFFSATSARYTALALDYTGFILSCVALLSLWGVWDSFEFISDGVLRVLWVMWGFALAYILNWLAGRAPEKSSLQTILQNAALVVAALSLVVILWNSGLVGGLVHVLGTYTNWQVLLVTVTAIISGVLGYRMLNLGPTYFRESPFEREAWQGWLMLSPNIFGFAIFFAGPLLLSFYLSFTDSSVGQIPGFIGLTNYIDILSMQFVPIGDAANAQVALGFEFDVLAEINWFGTAYVIGAKDTLFWRSMGNTLLFCLILVPLSTIPAIILAMLLNSDIPGMKFFRAVYFLPSVAAVVGTALVWRWLYDPTIGFINYAIGAIVGFLNTIGFVGLEDPAIRWLSDPGVVLISIVLLASWQVVGFNTVLFLAGLQGIPNSLYEAAEIDGANGWNRFWNVTLPLLAPTTFFVVVTTVIQGLQVFNEPYTLFPSRPIPTNATTIVYYLYEQGFQRTQFGYASTLAWILFAIIFVITFIQFRVQRADAYE